MEAVKEGFLLVADIGGYTRYLSEVELEHSQDVLADLIGVVADSLERSFQVVKLEGDAVFCRGSEPALLDELQECYSAFKLRQQTIALNSSCGCDACRRIPELDLKFVAHHGSFVEHRVAGRDELVGPDVVIVHRMLKNSVAEQLGVRAYALLSDACVARLQPGGRRLTPHSERYEDIGQVGGAVVALEQQPLAAARAAAAADADIALDVEVRATGPQVWDALTDPVKQLRWRVGATRIEPDGEPGLGTRTHCVHGDAVITQQIVEWQPHRRYAYTERNPIGPCLWTIELEPLAPAGTRVIWRIALTGGRRQRLLYALAGRRMRRVVQDNLAALASFVEA
jgi:uncharacterized protein YndB with AHSA1/START domain